MTKVCLKVSCDRPYYAKGLCQYHYNERRRRRNPRVREVQRQYVEAHKQELAEKRKVYLATPRARWLKAQYTATYNERTFNLSLDEFTAVTAKPCVYCGHGDGTEHVGLDRINPDFGYESWNVQPCCWTHNAMKNAQSHDEFVQRCGEVGQAWAEV